MDDAFGATREELLKQIAELKVHNSAYLAQLDDLRKQIKATQLELISKQRWIEAMKEHHE